jgi:ParB family chromosome partitioning protein
MKTGVERNVNYQMAGIQEPIPIENTASPIETEVKITNDVKLENIPIENINYGSNVREKYSDDDFAYLKDSISKYGILQPITVYKEDDNYIVKLGNARLQACKELYEDGDSRFKYINCIVIGVVEKSDVIVDQIIENLRRKDLTDADLLYILPTLKKQGFSDEKISELYKGRSKKTIQNLFSIINDIN